MLATKNIWLNFAELFFLLTQELGSIIISYQEIR